MPGAGENLEGGTCKHLLWGQSAKVGAFLKGTTIGLLQTVVDGALCPRMSTHFSCPVKWPVDLLFSFRLGSNAIASVERAWIITSVSDWSDG